MIFSGKTDRGKIRKANEDDFTAGNLPGNAVFAVVCDGMGGANGGSTASSTAVKIISHEIESGFKEEMSSEAVKDLMINAIVKANGVVFDKSREDKSLFGMGTTVVTVVAAGETAYIAHAGDSRAYLVDGKIEKLTRDHSIVQEMLENGKITREEALNHPQRNIITRALGVEETLDVDYNESEFKSGSSILICSDGLTSLVPDKEIEKIIADAEPSECAGKLIDAANSNGGSDNITVVVISNTQTGSEING